MRPLKLATYLHWPLLLLTLFATAAAAQTPVKLRDLFNQLPPDARGSETDQEVSARVVITSDARRAGKSSVLIYAQDSTRGILLFRRDTTLLAQFRPGDVVELVGRPARHDGMEELLVSSATLLDRSTTIVPRRITAADASREAFSGAFVRLSGELVVHRNDSWTNAILRDETGFVRLRIRGATLSEPGFVERLMRGGKVEIVGHVSQDDPKPPFDSGYEIVPLTDGGWNFAAVPPYRTIAWLSGLLLVSLLALYMYVQRRRAERHTAELRELAQRLESSKEELRHAQKLEAVGRLAGGVAHDFNNILTAITVNAALALDELDAKHPARTDVEEIKAASNRAAALTQQLLAFSRKQVLQPKVICVNSTITDLTRMLQRLLGEDLSLVTRLDGNAGSVYADATQLQQVLTNLAVNARDAMPGGGTLTISTGRFQAEVDTTMQSVKITPGSYARIIVSDTGCGMDGATKGAAFEPFFTTKPVGKGTGLGLSTAYGIVKQSGGFIFLESHPGEGTTFTVYLPLADREALANPITAELPTLARATKATILLVEDDVAVQTLVHRVLKRRGYTVIPASSGPEALEALVSAGRPIDLLLTDLVMPGGLNGRELFQHVAAKQPGVRVLFISGYTADDVMHNHVLEQTWPFLPKPFTPEAIDRKVAEVLERPANSPGLLSRLRHSGVPDTPAVHA